VENQKLANTSHSDDESRKGAIIALAKYGELLKDASNVEANAFKEQSIYVASIYLINCLNIYLKQLELKFNSKGTFSRVYGDKSKFINFFYFTQCFMNNDFKESLNSNSSILNKDILKLKLNDEDHYKVLDIFSPENEGFNTFERFLLKLEREDEIKSIDLEYFLNEFEILAHKRTDNSLVSDSPSEKDYLGRGPLINAITRTISDTQKNFTIGIFGDWGIGKSSFITSLKNQLLENNRESINLNQRNTFLFAEFNAWRYEQTDHLQSGMAQVMIERLSDIRNEDEIQKDEKLKKQSVNAKQHLIWLAKLITLIGIFLLSFVIFYPLLLSALPATIAAISEALLIATTGFYFFYKAFPKWLLYKVKGMCLRFRFALKLNGWAMLVTLISLVILVSSLIPNGPIAKWLQALEIYSWLGPLAVLPFLYKSGKTVLSSTAAKELKTLLELPSYAKHLGSLPTMRSSLETMCKVRLGSDHKLLYVVEDLDRCRPENILKVLEAVRLVMDLKNVVVVILVDQNIALAALSKHFSNIQNYTIKSPEVLARDYLAKIIQLGVTLEATTELTKLIAHSSQKPADLSDLYGMSNTQVNELSRLSKKLNIDNPRRIVQLINLYKTLRSCYQEIEDNENSQFPYPLLTNLMFIEWTLNHDPNIFDTLKKLFNQTPLTLEHEFEEDKIKLKKQKIEFEKNEIKSVIIDSQLSLIESDPEYLKNENKEKQASLKNKLADLNILKEFDSYPLEYEETIEKISSYDDKNGYYFNLVRPFLLPHISKLEEK